MDNNELDYLFRIQSQITPCLVEIPKSKKLYTVDLKSRKIDSPEFLSVEEDHLSNVIYFSVDRFYDYMDLSTASCVIMYQTPDGQSHMYPVPYYDVTTLVDEGKMIIPWNINGIVTKSYGTITYFIRFFKVDGDVLENAKLLYNLNTLSATSKVLKGLTNLNLNIEEDETFNSAVNTLEALISQVKALKDENFMWIQIKEE